MLVETFPDKFISAKLTIKNDEERKEHISSGKLSASMLGQPAQWQILKTLGIGQLEVDPYVLRKFERGRQVEDWLVANMPGVQAQQVNVEYRNVVGMVDAVIDTSGYDHKVGVIPYEIKSVTNAKFKNLKRTGQADPSHKLQAGLYALGMGTEHYAITYVASDDFRTLTWIYKTEDIKGEIDAIIENYDKHIWAQIVPKFEPRFDWQSSKQYNHYPEWADLKQEECQLAIKYHYPDVWEKVKQ